MTDQPGHTDDQERYHAGSIHSIVKEFLQGNISLRTKRSRIAKENESYYGGGHRSPVTGEFVTSPGRYVDHAAELVADASGISVDAASAALAAWRGANWHAAHTDDEGYARQLAAEGRKAFHDIIATAAPVLPSPAGERPQL